MSDAEKFAVLAVLVMAAVKWLSAIAVFRVEDEDRALNAIYFLLQTLLYLLIGMFLCLIAVLQQN